MKCPNCGAEIESGKFCEFCGAQLSTEMLKEQEQLNKQGCPKCGSRRYRDTSIPVPIPISDMVLDAMKDAIEKKDKPG